MSSSRNVVAFDALTDAELVVDRVYQGGSFGDVRDDPIGRLVPGVGNQGGFRFAGSAGKGARLVVLYTTGAESDWPDALDVYTGSFVYYGDNRSPGKDLHDTGRRGNQLLRHMFEHSRSTLTERASIPPILLFEKSGTGRDVRFRGLLAPGDPALSTEEELVGVWRTTGGHRFQNYRAAFTVLDAPQVTRAWLRDSLDGRPLADSCPPAWLHWVRSRTYNSLKAPPTIIVRSKAQQLPTSAKEREVLRTLHQHFESRPTDFEQFAADLWQHADSHVDKIDVTRPWRDGGRDAVGDYLIGPAVDPVAVEFALEAKCYGLDNGVGVRETSRLISRLRHRQFGVLVTTSYLGPQAYKEVRADGHPIVIIAGADVVNLLTKRDIRTASALQRFLQETYPPRSTISMRT
jgi:Restriction endonuclease AspBHI N-terminal/Restriction endonuclease